MRIRLILLSFLTSLVAHIFAQAPPAQLRLNAGEDTGRQIENLQRTREERAAYVGVVLASGRHSPASPLGSRNGIHIYSIVVPPGLSLRPVFEGPSVNLEDVASRQPLAQGRGQSIALDARGGPREVVLRVTGAKL